VRDPAAAASESAQRTKQRVEVTSERTETSTLFANPNGSFTLESSLVPVRVKRDGKWVTADPTLVRNADGSLSPVAAVTPMRFSGGGDTQFAAIGPSAKKISLGWDKKLPPPTISGSAATYPEVMPGVDLRVEAGVDGFTHMLVVKTRKAAANRALDRVDFTLSSPGLATRSAKAAGVVTATDGSGAVAMRGTAMMWDSRTQGAKRKPHAGHDDEGREPVAEEAEPRQSPVGIEVSGDQLAVVPDLKLLRGKDTQFPVMIDPVWQITGAGLNHWSTVSSNASSPLYNTGLPSSSNSYAGEIKVGKSPEDGGFVVRTFFEFNTSKVKLKNVSKAVFTIKQTWSSSYCGDTTARVTQLWGTKETDANTTWNTSWNKDRSGWLSAQGSNKQLRFFNSSKCPIGPVDFDATGFVQQKARAGASVTTLGLRAKDEGDTKSWKRFDKGTASLAITYNSYPNAPDKLEVDGKACNNGSKLWVRTRTPQLKARVTDPDTGQPMTGRLYWSPANTGISSSRLVQRANLGNPGIAMANTTQSLADGDYYLQALANDQINDSQPSAKCPFSVDATAPPKPTGVSAALYSDKNPHGGLGQPDLFTFQPPAVRTDFDHYCYTLADTTDSTSCKKVGADSNGVGQAVIYPAKQGNNVLRVWSVDKAGNLSKGSDTDFFAYEFGVGAGSPAAAHFKLDEGTGTSTSDAFTAHPDTATLSSGATWTAGRGGVAKALNLNGTSTGFAATGGPLTGRDAADTTNVTVRTDQSYTVSAWVKLTTKSANRVVLSQDGGISSAYQLEYTLSCDCWRFSVNQRDVAAPTVTAAAGPAGAALNVWTHLLGTYDSVGNQIKLYVNGKLVATSTVPVALWNATGVVAIGRSRLNSANTGFFAGVVDDVRVWNRAVTAADAKALFYPAPPVVSTASPDVTVGIPFTLTLGSGGDTNVKKYKYYTSIADVRWINANANGTPVTVQVTLTSADVAYVGAFAYYDDGTTLGAQSDAGRWDLRPHRATSISGRVIDGDTTASLAGVTVTLEPGGRTATTDSAGNYTVAGLTAGIYQVSAASGTSRCALFASTELDLPEGNTSVDLALGPQGDAYGYTCSTKSTPFIGGTEVVALDSNWATRELALPFPVSFYGRETSSVWVAMTGVASFKKTYWSDTSNASTLPDAHGGNALAAALWQDLVPAADTGSLRTALIGEAPNRKFVIEWHDFHREYDTAKTKFSFEMILGEDQTITYNYLNLPADRIAAGEAVVGLESPGGRVGLQYQANQAVVQNGQAITFIPPQNPQPIGSWTLSGQVTTSGGAPGEFNSVYIEPLGISDYVDSQGRYEFTELETGDYHVYATREKYCGDIAVADVYIDADLGTDLQLQPQVDAGGYRCSQESDRPFVRADTTVVPLTGDDAYKSVALPFPFTFYGKTYSTTWVDTNGLIYFTDPGKSNPTRTGLPDPAAPNNLIAALWTDMTVDASASVRTTTIGKSPNRQFVIEWRDVYIDGLSSDRFSLEVLLGEHGSISVNRDDIFYTAAGGAWGTIGTENSDGTAGYQFSYDEYSVSDEDLVILRPPGSENWTVTGTVRKPDGSPAAGAIVETESYDGPSAVTDANGRYTLTGFSTGTHDIHVIEERRCGNVASALNVHLEWNDVRDFVTSTKKDTYGYSCTVQAGTPFVRGTTQVPIDPDNAQSLELPFSFDFYGTRHTSLWFDAFGTLYAGAKPEHFNLCTRIPLDYEPNNLIAPFGAPLELDENSTMWTSVLGTGAQQQVLLEWRDVHLGTSTEPGPRFSFEALLSADGTITFNYSGISAALDHSPWGEGVAGVESPDGTYGLSVSDHERMLRDGEAVVIRRV
jgi:hypothetical protein